MSIKEEDLLNLPKAPDFISDVPHISHAEMIKICEKMLPHWNKIRFSKGEHDFIGEAFSLKEEVSE